MSKVGFLTTFYRWDPSYSITTVLEQQLLMLNKHGYETVLFVLPCFDNDDKVPAGTEIRKIVPQWILEPYGNVGSQVPEDFEDNVAVTTKAYEDNFKDLDVLIAHDIIFINTYLIYNVALKKANLNGLPMLHQIHSGPSERKDYEYPWSNLFTLPENSKLIYMNNTESVAMAEMYGVYPDKVRVVYNPMDVRELFGFSALIRRFIDEYDILSADVICTYPVSSTRMNDLGKAVRKTIAVMGNIKKMGKSIRIIIPNAHANGQDEKDIIKNYQQAALDNYGITDRELIFTSNFEVPSLEQGLPRKDVLSLLQISDLFIFPSYSENGPLILLEAAATKNLLVLNADFQPMADFFGYKGAYYFKFQSRLMTTNYTKGEDAYFEDVAKIVMSELNSNKILNAFRVVRKDFNYDAIFNNQLGPVIEESISGRTTLQE